MRPAPSTVEVTSTLTSGRRGSLTLDENSLVHIMDTLTNIYSDAEGAVIREYPSNAWDSHQRAGVKRPIEVTLPNDFDAVFRVRDFGESLTPDEIFEVYGKYGLSTKRGTDSEIGMLGIGAKAALTYVEQFTLRCVKDGQRFTATISTPTGGDDEDEDDESIWVSDPVETDEENGVEVSIAVIDPRSFNRKAREFFSYWGKDDVLIDGEPPEELSGQWIDENILIRSNAMGDLYGNSDLIVMGNVPYPVGNARYDYSDETFVAFVPIGSVDPTPSRESLKDTERSVETEEAVREFVHDRLLRIRQDALDACEHPHEAYKMLSEEWEIPPAQRAVLRYRGRRIRTGLYGVGFHYGGATVRRYSPTGGQRSGSYWSPPIARFGHRNLVIVTGYTNKTVHPRHRERIDRFLNNTHPSLRDVFLVEKLSDVKNLEWLDPERVTVVDWEEKIRPIALPKPERSRGPVNFMVYSSGASYPVSVTREEFTESHERRQSDVFYITPSEEKEYITPTNAAKMLGDSTILVKITKGQVKKFCRDYPGARSAVQALGETMRVVSTSFSPSEIAWFHDGTSRRAPLLLESIDLANVYDPDLKSLLKEIENIDHEKVDLWKRLRSNTMWKFRAVFGLPHGIPLTDDASHLVKQVESALARYPLISQVNTYNLNPKHLLEYINAIYIYRNEA